MWQAEEQFLSARGDLMNPNERWNADRQIRWGKAESGQFGGNANFEGRAKAQADERFAAATAGLDTPVERLQNRLRTIRDKLDSQAYATDDQQNRDRAAREYLLAEKDFRASAAPQGLAGGSDVSTSGGYSTIINAQYGASVQAELQKQANTLLGNILGALTGDVARQRGWQHRTAFNGAQ